MTLIAIHLGINPVIGGRPPMDRSSMGIIHRVSLVTDNILLVFKLEDAPCFPIIMNIGKIIITYRLK